MEVSLADLQFDPHAIGVFVLVTVAMAGSAAWLAGRAIASTWRPWWQVVLYMLLLAWVSRFLHYALFDATLMSLPHYLLDAAVCMAAGLLGYRVMRVRQMVTHYGWTVARAGPLNWRWLDPDRRDPN
jgi:hypothetical protein